MFSSAVVVSGIRLNENHGKSEKNHGRLLKYREIHGEIKAPIHG